LENCNLQIRFLNRTSLTRLDPDAAGALLATDLLYCQ
jgi:hypothetical protein